MTKLKIAVQKSGRLQEKTVALLKECGLSFNNG
ncbi:MAG: ATP phosphoribosyltransferase, partial [Bacteroidota bacterium]